MKRASIIDRLVVFKSRSLLEAWDGDILVATYDAATGRGGPGHKAMEGDRRTPEGEYRIDSRHESLRYELFLHISYPNEADARAFLDKMRDGSLPADATIGGAIGLHGPSPDGLRGDWTHGCVAVSSEAIEVLYAAVAQDARITIRP